MKKIEDVFNEWEKDCAIDDIELGKESIKTAKLHAKYLILLTRANMAASKIGQDYAALRNKKTRYYRGTMTQEELEENGWEQFPFKLRDSQIEKALEEDQDIISLASKKILNDELAAFYKEAVASMKSRTWQIKTAVDHARFVGGN